MASKGYYGSSYDRYAAHNEQSTVHKLKETYWTTKQAVIKKLGKKEDAHVVSSDAELDAKLEVFQAIRRSSMELLRVIEHYQDRLCVISQEENATGRFLKSQSQRDRTRAGKMAAAVGKSLSFASQQRLGLRVPLVRLYQEVETFRYRAISDTLMTINRMEGARTEYRGALLWMKDQSNDLDPDTYKQLEKFRKIQAQVKKTKARFDRLKLDTMQKIDLLAASRCNMFSHVLANYQCTLLQFWSKTSRTMSAVAESFKGYQYYEFNMLKDLCEPTKKLAEETSNRQVAERDTDTVGSDGELYDEEEEESNDSTKKRKQPITEEDESSVEGTVDDLLGLSDEISEENPLESMTNERPSGHPSNNTEQSQHTNNLVEPESAKRDEIREFMDFENFTSNINWNTNSTVSNKPDSNASENVMSPELLALSDDKAKHSQGSGHINTQVDQNLNNKRTATKNLIATNHMTLNLSELPQMSKNIQLDKAELNKVTQGGTEKKVSLESDLMSSNTDNIEELERQTESVISNFISNALIMHERQAAQDDVNLSGLINWDEEAKGVIDEANGAEKTRNKGSGKHSESFIEFEDEDLSYEELKKKQDEELDFTGKILERKEREKKERKQKKNAGEQDLLCGDIDLEEEKDDLQLLNEILDAPSTGEDEFSKEWQAVFGATPLAGPGSNHMPAESDQSTSDFLPSNLLASRLGNMSLGAQGLPQQMPMQTLPGGQQQSQNAAQKPQKSAPQKPKPKKGQKTDMSAWFNLFADLDPLSNPDAIGKSEDILEGAL